MVCRILAETGAEDSSAVQLLSDQVSGHRILVTAYSKSIRIFKEHSYISWSRLQQLVTELGVTGKPSGVQRD